MSDEKRVLLNLQLIAERRAALRLTPTGIAAALGCSSPVMRLLERGENHEGLSVGFVRRLAELLGLSLASVFASDAEVPAPSPDDVAVEAALATRTKSCAREDLAAALGWDLPRVVAALDALEARLAATGARLHRRENGDVALAARTEVLSREQLVRLERAQSARRGLTTGAAEVLYELSTSGPAWGWDNDTLKRRVDIATLLKQDIACADGDGNIALSEAARFSLLLTNGPVRGRGHRRAP